MKRKLSFKNLFQSIHFKLPVLFMLLLLAAFQLTGVFFISQLETQLVSNFETQLDNQSSFLANSALSILQKDNLDDMKQESNTLLQTVVGKDILNVQLIDKKNEIIAVANPVNQGVIGTLTDEKDIQDVILSGSPRRYQYVDAASQKSVLRIMTPIVKQDRSVIGAIVVDGNIETVYTQIQETSKLFVNTMIVALVITLILAVFISRVGIAKPVGEMKKKTEQIAIGQYDGEVAIYGNDELGVLARSINDLAIRIKEAQDSTEAERQRLNGVLKHMSDGVIATDRRGNVMIVNEAAVRLLDKPEESLLNTSIMDILMIRNKYTFRQLLETQDELILSVHVDGIESIVRGEFSVIQRDSGFISGLVCVLSDITEQEKIEKERREFVSNVSHELRTPLTSMKSYTEALVEGAWQDTRLAPEFLHVIQSETERMMRMISDLLNLSRMDADKQVLRLEVINMQDLVRNILDRFDMLLRADDYIKKDYRIVREFSATSTWVEVDQDRIIQVIDNIMHNAIKYSPDGGRIICRIVESGDNVVISITDEGLGIPRKDLPHIFERFYRVDKARSRAQGGTGLGLAISKEVIKLHGGKIWANSIENQGSTFLISLPRVTFFDEGDEWG